MSVGTEFRSRITTEGTYVLGTLVVMTGIAAGLQRCQLNGFRSTDEGMMLNSFLMAGREPDR